MIERVGDRLDYLNMMIPPMKVAQSAAPQAVAKLSRWASFTNIKTFAGFSPFDRDPNVSGENITPAAKNATAARNLVSQPIADDDGFRSLFSKDEIVVAESKVPSYKLQDTRRNTFCSRRSWVGSYRIYEITPNC